MGMSDSTCVLLAFRNPRGRRQSSVWAGFLALLLACIATLGDAFIRYRAGTTVLRRDGVGMDRMRRLPVRIRCDRQSLDTSPPEVPSAQ